MLLPFDRVIGEGVADAVARQVAAGIDIVSDGEMGKISYATYIKDRITGFAGDSPPASTCGPRSVPLVPRPPGEGRGHPQLSPAPLRWRGEATDARAAPRRPASVRRSTGRAWTASGLYERRLARRHPRLFQPNDYYPDDDAYLEALAEAMRPEYEAIVKAGLILQLDSPDLGAGAAHDVQGPLGRRISDADRAARRGSQSCATHHRREPGADARLLGAIMKARIIAMSRW